MDNTTPSKVFLLTNVDFDEINIKVFGSHEKAIEECKSIILAAEENVEFRFECANGEPALDEVSEWDGVEEFEVYDDEGTVVWKLQAKDVL